MSKHKTKKGGRKKPTLKQVVDQLIGTCVKAVEDKRIQGTVADLIRMRDLQEEIAPSKPAQRVTRWIDS